VIWRSLAIVGLAACGNATGTQPFPGFDAQGSGGPIGPTLDASGPHGFDARADAPSPFPDASSPIVDASVPVITDPLYGLSTGTARWQVTCGRGYGDAVSAAFCAGSAPPSITSINDVEVLLGMVPGAPNIAVTFAGETTGLELRGVTPINPRAFIIDSSRGIVLTFARGEPFAEMVAPDSGTFRFFLLRFTLACDPSCNFADLLTPTIESGWTGYSLYDDKAIGDTTLDCLNCHQPDGPGNVKVLRMQEIAQPWDHWFYDAHGSGHAMIDDFLAAHGTESYGGIPASMVRGSTPQPLADLLAARGFGEQPDAFDSTKIEAELAQSGSSPTWNSLYANSVAGTEIPTAYFGVPHTDASKTAQMITAYQQTMAGTLPRDQMPDIRQTIRADALAQLSIHPKAGLDGKHILIHMCRMCHNSQLDQTLSRSYFNVDTLGQLSAYEKGIAVQRLMKTDYQQMPPARFHELSDAERAAAIAALQ